MAKYDYEGGCPCGLYRTCQPSCFHYKEEPMSLGSKLAETLDALEAANLKTLEEKANADIEKIKQERDKLVRMVDGFRSQIETAITNGRVPLIKEKDYEKKNWIRSAVAKKAKHQDVWDNFGSWARTNAIYIVVKEAHDGIGIEDWVNITVEPVRKGYRGFAPSKSNEYCSECGLPHSECDPDGVGHYRG